MGLDIQSITPSSEGFFPGYSVTFHHYPLLLLAQKTPEDVLTGRKLPACDLTITGIFKGF